LIGQEAASVPGTLEELPEGEKDKDRDLVRGIPVILTRAGYAIVKANG